MAAAWDSLLKWLPTQAAATFPLQLERGVLKLAASLPVTLGLAFSPKSDSATLRNGTMAKSPWRGQRKRRTRQHVIAEMSINYLERQVLRRGHQLRRVPQPEYGTDAEMLHFSPDTGELENGRIQFKSKRLTI